MFIEAPTVMPTEVQTIAVESAVSAEDGEQVEIGGECLTDDECLSKSCFLRPVWPKKGKCQCEPCSTAGCGGCSATSNCKTITPLIPNMCAFYVPRPTGIPTELQVTFRPTNGPSYVPSYHPSYNLIPSYNPTGPAQCLENSQCKEGFVCDIEYGCRKIVCWRDRECSKYDAYCNQIEVCEAEKKFGANCVNTRECSNGICESSKCQSHINAPSLSTTDLSFIDPEPKDTVSDVTSSVNAVYNEAKDFTDNGALNLSPADPSSIDTKAKDTVNGRTASVQTAPSGPSRANYVMYLLTLAVFFIFFWVVSHLIRRGFDLQLKIDKMKQENIEIAKLENIMLEKYSEA